MPNNQPECPKCGHGMTEGFIPIADKTARPAAWQRGKPERSFWTGIKLRRNEQVPLSAYRCDECGYLEFYAVKPKPSEPEPAPAAPAKTMECVSCRKTVEADVDRCPHCGWLFQ